MEVKNKEETIEKVKERFRNELCYDIKNRIDESFSEWSGTKEQLELLEAEEDEKGVEYLFGIIDKDNENAFSLFYSLRYSEDKLSKMEKEVLDDINDGACGWLIYKLCNRDDFEEYLGMNVEDYFILKRKERREKYNLKLEKARIKLESSKTFEEHTGTLVDMLFDKLLTKEEFKEELKKAEIKYPRIIK